MAKPLPDGGPLPDGWTEDTDSKNRTYYSNHRTRETTWTVSDLGHPPIYHGLPNRPKSHERVCSWAASPSHDAEKHVLCELENGTIRRGADDSHETPVADCGFASRSRETAPAVLCTCISTLAPSLVPSWIDKSDPPPRPHYSLTDMNLVFVCSCPCVVSTPSTAPSTCVGFTPSPVRQHQRTTSGMQ